MEGNEREDYISSHIQDDRSGRGSFDDVSIISTTITIPADQYSGPTTCASNDPLLDSNDTSVNRDGPLDLKLNAVSLM